MTQDEKAWREIVDNPNYEISNTGDVRHKEKKKILKQRISKWGYARARLSVSGQIATNSKLLAYFLYRRWDNFSKKYLNERDDNFGYTIAVSLYERNKEGLYNAIKR